MLNPPDSRSAQERLRQRVEDLSILSRQMEVQRGEESEPGTAETVPQPQGDDMPLQAEPAEREAVVMTGEILDPLPAPDAERIAEIDATSREIEEHLRAAERETEALTAELRKLDETFSAGVTELEPESTGETLPPVVATEPAITPPVEASEPVETKSRTFQARPLRGVANVIQLAARIRGIQKNANGSS
jgi:hypothetical protein